MSSRGLLASYRVSCAGKLRKARLRLDPRAFRVNAGGRIVPAIHIPDPRRYLTLVRESHGRRGPLNVARLPDKQGDAKLTDDMPTLANCDKARVFSLYDRCKARYGLCP
jgi:hypothetical protein